MRFISRRHATIAAAVLTAVSIVGISPVQAAVRSFGKNYQVTATVKGAQNMTVLLMSAKGQTLASAAVTKSSQKITLKTAPTTSTKGATLQLVSGSGKAGKGAYYGPVVIGWKGTKASTASKVTSKLKASTSTKIALGTVQVKAATGSAKQGYAVALAASKLADTSTAALAKASKGKPSGVGNYGKNQSVSSGDFTVSIASVHAAACSPVGTATCDPQGNPIGAPNGVVNQPVNNGPSAVVADDDMNGGDKDDDGIPNAFDVNDDGDSAVDAADADTPAPKVSAEGATTCASMDFKIFTNFKATDANYSGTINAYATGGFQATRDRSATVIGQTMSMVFSPITNVCGSAVTASYLKGNGVTYAPSDYVKLGNPCSTGDYQWLIGAGRMCDANAGSTSGFDFGSKYQFSGTDLPSGQDTFTMKVETADGNSYEFTSSPGFVFVTHPMLITYDNGAGYSGTIQYGQQNIAPIQVGSSNELTLTMFRPQRLAFDGEAGYADGAYYDLAAFKYTPDIPNGIRASNDPGSPSSPGPGKCDALTFKDSTMTDDTLVNTATKPTMTLKWRLNDCFRARNVAWSAGYLTVDIQVEPTGPGGNSAQKLWLQLLP